MTEKVRRPETNVLSLCFAANHRCSWFIIIVYCRWLQTNNRTWIFRRERPRSLRNSDRLLLPVQSQALLALLPTSSDVQAPARFDNRCLRRRRERRRLLCRTSPAFGRRSTMLNASMVCCRNTACTRLTPNCWLRWVYHNHHHHHHHYHLNLIIIIII